MIDSFESVHEAQIMHLRRSIFLPFTGTQIGVHSVVCCHGKWQMAIKRRVLLILLQ